MKYILFTIILCCLSLTCSITYAADWIPYIHNYNKSEYGNGASTWRIATYGQWTLFANQHGLLTFDGKHWTRFQLNNRSETRGVAISPKDNIIYVSGENEFGYYDIKSNGTLNYHCLSEKAPAKFSHVGNMFDFYELNGSIYIRGDNYIIIRNGKKMNLIKSPHKMFSSTMAEGSIYVGTDHGVYLIAGKQYIPLPGGEQLKNQRISTMFPLGGKLIIGTTERFYSYDGKNIQPFNTKADKLIETGTISCATVWKSKIAIGTIHNGLIIEDIKSGTVQHFDETNGLQNNTVLSAAFDQHGNVWAGLSFGIDYILLESPFTYLYHSPHSYGIGYSAQIKDNLLYIGTDRGLYFSSFPVTFNGASPDIHPTTCPSGPAWYLYKYGNELFCMHDKGIFTISGSKATRITDIYGAWSGNKVNGRKNMIFVGTYEGMYVISKQGNTWVSKGRIKGIEESGRFFKQTGNNKLKIYNPANETATEYTLSNDLLRVVGKRHFKEVWKDDTRNNNTIFDPRSVITGPTLHLQSKHDIVPYDEGFMLVNYNRIANNTIRVRIHSLQTYPNDSTVYMDNIFGIKPRPAIKWSDNSIRIEYEVSQTDNTPFKFQYRLNDEKWSAPTSATSKEYSDLHEGKYTFQVRILLPNGKISTDSLSFVILTPWFRSWLAYIIYIILAVVIVHVFMHFEKLHVRRKQEQAVEEKNKEVKQMKKEIGKLEKDKIDLDMRHKSQEIANLILNITRKNEILQEIKEDVKRVATRMGMDTPKESKRSLLLINNKIDSNIEGDDILKKVEDEFDLVSNSLMKKLSILHPDLTHNDRLMCAYLKMNLSSKEIAPLLNISVRGVETNRYRLRKKLGLDRDSSFLEYFNHIENTPIEELKK